MSRNDFDPVKKGGGPPTAQQQHQQPPAQYSYALPVESARESSGGGGGGYTQQPQQASYNIDLGQIPSQQQQQVSSGGAPSSYNIDLSGSGGGMGGDATKGSDKQQQPMGRSSYGQEGHGYPEAEVNYADPNAPPAEGEPLYPPEETAASPELRRFVKGGCRDVWAAVLFGLLFALTVVWGIVNMATYKIVESTELEQKTPMEELWETIGPGGLVLVFIMSLVVSIAFTVGNMILIRCMPTKVIYIANIGVSVMYIVTGILLAINGAIVGLIVMLVMAGLQLLWLYLVRSRIHFAAVLIKTTSMLLTRYKSVVAANYLVAVGFFIFCIFWGFAILPPADKLSAGVGNDSGNGVLVAVFVLALLWTAQVAVNIGHVTTSGVVATWYFAGTANMPKSPTLASFKRAVTTSFGSICFGSLLVAVIQFIRWLAESSRSGDNDNSFLRCIAICLLKMLERIVQYFNNYAFVHVAIYGCGYIEAAMKTFALCKQCFFAAYFNDCLIGPTLRLLAIATAAFIAAVFALILHSWIIFVWVFAMAWFVQSTLFASVSSAVTALFVCFAQEPEALQRSDPELYAAIHTADGGAVHNGNAPQPTA